MCFIQDGIMHHASCLVARDFFTGSAVSRKTEDADCLGFVCCVHKRVHLSPYGTWYVSILGHIRGPVLQL